MCLPPQNALPDGAEPFEWPERFGDIMPEMDAFVGWCDDVEIDAFQTIRSMRIAHRRICNYQLHVLCTDAF